jgi:hypothetical protein
MDMVLEGLGRETREGKKGLWVSSTVGLSSAQRRNNWANNRSLRANPGRIEREWRG